MNRRYALGLTLALFAPSALHAQVGFDRAFSAGSPGNDRGTDVAVDDAGEVIVVGSSGGLGTAFIAKHTPDGDTLWVRRTGEPNASPERIVVDGTGIVYVAGAFSGVSTWDGGANPGVTLTSRGGLDAFLARYTADGDLEWVAQAGGDEDDIGFGVAVTEDGGSVYLAGGFENTATFGTATALTSAGLDDAFVARYEAGGAFEWARRGGGTQRDVAFAVAVDEEENAYLTGSFEGEASFGPPALTSAGLDDLFVVKYNATSTALWSRQIGGTGIDRGTGLGVYSCCTGSLSVVYVTGSFEDTITVGMDALASAGASDVLVASLEEDGAPRWGVRSGGAGEDAGTDLDLVPWFSDIPEAAVYVTGYVSGDGTYGPFGETFAGFGSFDGFSFRLYDFPAAGPYGLGGIGPFVTLGGTGEDRGSGIGIGTRPLGAPLSRPLAATGFFSGEALIGGTTLTSVGGKDLYVGYAFRTLVATEPEPTGAFRLSPPRPNPSPGTATLALTLMAPEVVRAEVLDPLGRRVALLHDGPLAAGAHALVWEAGRATAGLYLVRVAAGAEALTRSVVRAR
jgi:hypothetical protein